MYTNASLVLDQAKDAVVVPVEALDRARRPPTCWSSTASDGSNRGTVTIGLETADRAEIRNGLAAGELVVVGNRAQLKAGTLVSPKVMEPTAAEQEAR